MKKLLIFIFIFTIFSVFFVSADADITNPNISIISPENNFETDDINLDINYIASDDIAIGSCWYSDNSGGIILLENCENISDAQWAEGLHSIEIGVNDSSGNENTALVSFTINSYKILFKNFAPQEFKKGDAQFNIQVQNKKTESVANLIALVSGKGFSTYNAVPVDLDPNERGYILFSGNFKEAGVITLKIIIDGNVFYQNVTVIDDRNASQEEIDRLNEEAEKKNLLANISNQIDYLKENYNKIESDLEIKTENNYDVSRINLNNLKTYIINVETAILEENVNKAKINLQLASEEYETQKNRIDNAKKKSIILIIKENALIFSAIIGSVIAFFTLYELLKKKGEKVVSVAKKVVIRKKDIKRDKKKVK